MCRQIGNTGMNRALNVRKEQALELASHVDVIAISVENCWANCSAIHIVTVNCFIPGCVLVAK